MSNEHIEVLRAAREEAVAARRQLALALAQPGVADTLAQPYTTNEIAKQRELFVAIQKTVEAIEDAIKHEETLFPHKMTKSPFPV